MVKNTNKDIKCRMLESIGKLFLCAMLTVALVPSSALAQDDSSSLAPGSYGPVSVSENTETDAFESDEWSAYRHASALGTAGSFHIVAFENANLNSDVYGGVLAKRMGTSHTFGMSHIPTVSYIQDYAGSTNNFDKRPDGVIVFGSDMELGLSGNPVSYKSADGRNVSIDAPRNIVKDADTTSSPFISLERVKKESAEISDRLAAHEDTGASYDFTDQNKKKIRYEMESGCAYLTISAQDLVNGNKVDIEGMPGDGSATLVVNVDCSGGDVSLPDPITLELGGEKASFGEVDSMPAGYVLWNFVNAEGKTIELHSLVGSAIAMGGTLELGGHGYGNSCGTFIADYVNVSAESHYRPFDGEFDEPSGSTSISLSGVKTVSGETPDDSFAFTLSKWNGSAWEDTDTVFSDADTGSIVFPRIEIGQDDLGTSWYRVSEVSADGYVCSPAVYYIEVTAALSADGKEIDVTQTIYASSELGEHVPSQMSMVPSESMNFDNEPVEEEKNTKIQLEKCWSKGSVTDIPESILVGISNMGEGEDIVVELSRDNGWKASIELDGSFEPGGVYELDDNGNRITEGAVSINGGMWSMSVSEGKIDPRHWVYIIDNEKRDENVSVSVNKLWSGDEEQNRPASVSMNLYSCASDGNESLVESFEVNAESGWTWSKSELPRFDAAGNELAYRVEETPVPGYTANITTVHDSENGAWHFAVENTKNDEEPGEISFTLSGYSLSSKNGELDAEKVCYVDPKIVKTLVGRALTDGEFAFELVDDNTGEVVSATTNDALGMVDFDAAANKAPEGMEPCCLIFKAPGTYTYTVRESAGVDPDPSVEYSREKVQFTAVVEENNDGALVCTDQYYTYYKDKNDVAGIRMEASDHPVIENTARPVSLSVRKVSTADTQMGLPGAVYRLWDADSNTPVAVSGESDENGWMVFESDAISYGTRYYLTEEKAPEGYTLNRRPSETFTIERTGDKHFVKTDSGETGSTSDLEYPAMFDIGGGMKDEPLSFTVVKIAGDTGEVLPGASMYLYRTGEQAKQELSQWTSGDEPEIIGNITAGSTFVIGESSAPDGYLPIDELRFTITETGAIEITGDSSSYTVGNVLYIVDEPEDQENIPDETIEPNEVPLAQTGDETNMMLPAIIAIVSAAVMLFSIVARRKMR